MPKDAAVQERLNGYRNKKSCYSNTLPKIIVWKKFERERSVASPAHGKELREMFKQNVAPAHEIGQARSRYQPKAHQLFRRAREWQYGVFPLGKHTKRFVIQDRLKVLCRALVSFDATGTGTSIYPAVNSIVKKVNELEALGAKDGTRAHIWDKRKVYRYLRVLEDSAVMTCSGSAHNRQPRHRVLHADKLLKLPLNRPKTVNRRRESVTCEPANLSPVEQPNLSPKNTWGEIHTPSPSAVLGESLKGIAVAQSSSEVMPTAKPIDDAASSPSESNSDSQSQPADHEKAREYNGRQAAMEQFMDETGACYEVVYMAAELIDSRRKQTRLSNPREWYLTALRNLSDEDTEDLNERHDENEEYRAALDAEHELNHWNQFDVHADGVAHFRNCTHGIPKKDCWECSCPDVDEYTAVDIDHRDDINLAIAESQRTGYVADGLLYMFKNPDKTFSEEDVSRILGRPLRFAHKSS